MENLLDKLLQYSGALIVRNKELKGSGDAFSNFDVRRYSLYTKTNFVEVTLVQAPTSSLYTKNILKKKVKCTYEIDMEISTLSDILRESPYISRVVEQQRQPIKNGIERRGTRTPQCMILVECKGNKKCSNINSFYVNFVFKKKLYKGSTERKTPKRKNTEIPKNSVLSYATKRKRFK